MTRHPLPALPAFGAPLLWLLLALAAAACTSDGPDDGEGAGASFYAEGRVEVGPRPDDPLARVGAEAGNASLVRWWFASPDRWRWEIETVEPPLDAGTLLTVSDGDSTWT